MVAKRRVRVDGMAHFPQPLPVSGDALGIMVNTKIADIAVKLILPMEAYSDVGAGLIPPTDEKGTEIAPALNSFRNEWGIKSDETTYMISAARASFLITPPTADDPLPEDLRRLGEQFGSWFDIVYHWAYAWSGLSMQRSNQVRPNAFHFIVPRVGLRGSGIHVNVVMSSGTRPLSRRQVEAAFAKASNGIHLPTEHRLLMSAG